MEEFSSFMSPFSPLISCSGPQICLLRACLIQFRQGGAFLVRVFNSFTFSRKGFFIIWDKFSLSSPGWPQTLILLSSLLSPRITGVYHHTPLGKIFNSETKSPNFNMVISYKCSKLFSFIPEALNLKAAFNAQRALSLQMGSSLKVN
jgi:hypothetical protein